MNKQRISKIILSTSAVIVMALFLILTLPGCTGHAESFGAGLATGSAVTHTLEGAQKDLQVRQANLIAERQAILDQLESANSDVEKLAMQAKVDALEKQLQQTASISTGVLIADKVSRTDWTDPDQAAPWLLTAITTAYGYLVTRKKKSLSELLTAVNEGVEKFKAQSEPVVADKLYADIKERKKLNGVQ